MDARAAQQTLVKMNKHFLRDRKKKKKLEKREREIKKKRKEGGIKIKKTREFVFSLLLLSHSGTFAS